MKNLETITATPNYSKRTFTLRTSSGNKYRTIQLSQEEFDSCEHNTSADWRQFLTSEDYYVVKTKN
jgi:predicted secreted protein